MLLGTPIQTDISNAFVTSIGGDAVNHIIGIIIRPGSVFDNGIKGIGTRNKTECANDFPMLIFTCIAMFVGNFFGNQVTL